MSYLVLARKYRPQTFEEVIDQVHVTQTLKNAIDQDRVAHAVVFCGPRGTGKTTVARILAKSMNCIKGPAATPCNQCRSCREIASGNAVDVFEIDGASNNSVDQIRDLRENLKYMPAHSPYKIYIIDEVHMLSTAAFNALLKTLEEPPAHVMFLFATTEPHKIPVTILSRCQRHDLRRIRVESIVKQLAALSRKEGYDVSENSLMAIARQAGGSLRDAMSLLDQVMVCAGQTVRSDDVTDILGIVDRRQLTNVSQAVLNRNPVQFLDTIDDLYGRGHDMKRFYGELIEHFRNLLVVKIGSSHRRLIDLPAQEIEQLQQQADRISEAQLSQILDILFSQEAKIRYASQPKLALESVLLRIFHTRPAVPIHVLIDKLDALRRDLSPDHRLGASATHHHPVESTNPARPAPTPEPTAPIDSHGTNDSAEGLQTTPGSDPSSSSRHASWQAIRQAIAESNPSLAAHLTHSRIRRRDDHQIDIELTGSEFNLNMVQRARSIDIIQQACRQYFNKDIPVTVSLKKTAGTDGATPQNATTMKNEALHHPLVADAIEIFDGKVVDIKILKEENE